jgi:hypothetical protein
MGIRNLIALVLVWTSAGCTSSNPASVGSDATSGDATDTADACPASTTWFDGACRKLCQTSPPECATNELCDMSAGCFANCDPMDCSTVCWGVCAPVHGD